MVNRMRNIQEAMQPGSQARVTCTDRIYIFIGHYLLAHRCSTGRNRAIKPNSSESSGVISSGFRDPRIRIRGDRVTAPQNTHSLQYGFGRGYAGRLDGKRIFRTKNSDGKEVSRRFWTISYLLHGTAFGKIDFGKYRTTSPQFRKGRTVILSPSYKSNTLIKRSKVPSPQPHRTATGKQ